MKNTWHSQPCFIVLSLGGPSSLCQSLPAGFGAFHLGPNQSPGITWLPGMWGVVGPFNLRWIGDVRILLKLFVHGFEMVKISCSVFFCLVFSCWTFRSQTYWPVLDTRVMSVARWLGVRLVVKDMYRSEQGLAGKLEVTKPTWFWMSRFNSSCQWSSNHSLDGYGSGFG